jgi:excisionase family DNA binding protein
MEDVLSTEQAAQRLGVSARRVQQLIKSGRLPAREFGGSYMIAAGDLKLVESRPPGRPPTKPKAEPAKAPRKSRKKAEAKS